MQVNNVEIYKEANQLLKKAYGENAKFREGQYEAIEATMTKSRTLVVQKTGWGKSLVYFICTKLFRNRGYGCTFVISPLLVLMKNQIKMASQMNLKCAELNGNSDKKIIIEQIKNNKFDIVFITPETLLSDIVKEALRSFRIKLIVIDEAHCISDWGHDFRLEYSKIGRIIKTIQTVTAVIATTATANNRVIRDLKKQLGEDVYVSRGPLTRESLRIQILRLEKRQERYAWLLDNIPKLPKPGIIYCLDTWDCDNLASFLSSNGIKAMSYHSKKKKEETNAVISAFESNNIDVIVATIKLGMGYDKGDIAFIIHFQMPSSIVGWYQQIGRAGRSLKDAYVFLMTGEEDDRINNYFINSAFPERNLSQKVYECISNSDGVSLNSLTAKINGKKTKIEKALDFMDNEGFIYEFDGRYYSTPKEYVFPEERYNIITSVRHDEVCEMHNLVETKECYSRFAVRLLDDLTAPSCGKCYNCTGHDIFHGLSISDNSINTALKYLDNNSQTTIAPREKVFDENENKYVYLKFKMKPGICLSKYGRPRYGEMVKNGKYPKEGNKAEFSEELVDKSAKALSKMINENKIKYITFVPSVNSSLVKNFTERLAKRTGLTFLELLRKAPAEPQKKMQNSFFQYKNAFESFFAVECSMPEKVILVDDVVDSRWTLSVCAVKLGEKGCQAVYPFALADSSNSEES